ncbi:LuxR C-terminal-related transcriptional regulator [Pontimicrobium aquaticum]|uniref:LuxR family transcriptional regulator n=1 Tax=Pontimicrobium aquaticum TaxID=2565367 RepID=A0A4U0EP07_9FLAO|nr:LuxR C-terminal-related transcriptional regulator [Pontimicrobium aquaticum]TJY33353.1 LuxR family transcriptional regulator [Pontimicrobium aquaticum]
MLLTNFKRIYKRISDSINNPTLTIKDIDRIITTDCSITYNPTFICIINRKNLEVDFVSKNMHACLGFDNIELTSNGLKFLWKHIHEDDLSCLVNSLSDIVDFIDCDLNQKETEQYSYTWNYRIKRKDNSYVNIFQNTTPFFIDSNKKHKALTYFTVINSNKKIPIQASIQSLNSNNNLETKYSTNCSQTAFLKKISSREKDIIRLLVKKKTSKSIAKRLFISSNTVDTHRRNILRKLKLSSTGELINILKSQQNLF